MQAATLAVLDIDGQAAALLALDLGVDDAFIVAAAAIGVSPVQLVQLLPVVPMSLGLARVSFATRRRGLVKLARMIGARTESVTLSMEAPRGTVSH